jgi:DNA-binding protein HU-alpha
MVTKAGARGSAAKPATARGKAAVAARKPAAAAAEEPVVVAEAAPEAAQPDFRRTELLTQVVARSGVKKKFAKPVLEAALALIGEALADGRDLNLEPLGKVRINRVRQMAKGRVTVARIRQAAPRADAPDAPDTPRDKDAKEGVADPAE